MAENVITVFGTTWCGDCHRVRRFFDRNSVRYKWIDIDHDESAEKFVIATNHGMRSVPTIVCEDGSIMVEPSEVQLKQYLDNITRTN